MKSFLFLCLLFLTSFIFYLVVFKQEEIFDNFYCSHVLKLFYDNANPINATLPQYLSNTHPLTHTHGSWFAIFTFSRVFIMTLPPFSTSVPFLCTKNFLFNFSNRHFIQQTQSQWKHFPLDIHREIDRKAFNIIQLTVR